MLRRRHTDSPDHGAAIASLRAGAGVKFGVARTACHAEVSGIAPTVVEATALPSRSCVDAVAMAMTTPEVAYLKTVHGPEVARERIARARARKEEEKRKEHEARLASERAVQLEKERLEEQVKEAERQRKEAEERRKQAEARRKEVEAMRKRHEAEQKREAEERRKREEEEQRKREAAASAERERKAAELRAKIAAAKKEKEEAEAVAKRAAEQRAEAQRLAAQRLAAQRLAAQQQQQQQLLRNTAATQNRMKVVVPPGKGPGSQMQVRTPAGQVVNVEVPAGITAGMPFEFVLPPQQQPQQQRMSVQCPPGLRGGCQMQVSAGGRIFQVRIPMGVQPGQHFVIAVPRA